ncbi:MAG: FAD-binding oxidoreductase [Dehalococcoidia bacterium]|nr:FAD-binding oxidoreductase [Dehalococcoidia bacterium]MSQ17646.1 FAD-binding oxidoreductase [Dehalococcoidia bacterium]
MTLSQHLSSLLEAGIQVLPPERLPAYAIDGQTPQAVAQPATRQEVAQVLQWASAEGLAVCPWGGGTQMGVGNLPRQVDLVLDLARLDRLLDFQPADLTVTVEAGMTLAVLQSALAQGGKFLPVEAPLADQATIGGILATGATGPLRLAYGLPRDWLIGIGVVSAQGVASKAGGKVVKNVTGYDLNKLYTGSLGTLGVIVEATFKLSPRPADFAALVTGFPSAVRAVLAGQQLAGQVFAPQGLQVVTGPVVRRLGLEQAGGNVRKSPLAPLYERRVGGISRIAPEPRTGEALAIAFFQGRGLAVRRRLEESRRLLQSQGGSEAAVLDAGVGQELLGRLTGLGWAAETAPRLGLKVSVPPSAVGQVAALLSEDAASGADTGIIADPGFGTVRLLQWGEIPPNPPFAKGGSGGFDGSPEKIARLRDQVRKLNGWVVVEQCPLGLKQQVDVWDVEPQALEVMRRLKQKFDPLGTLNPGRFAGRL